MLGVSAYTYRFGRRCHEGRRLLIHTQLQTRERERAGWERVWDERERGGRDEMRERREAGGCLRSDAAASAVAGPGPCPSLGGGGGTT